jgi:hypothetical protein
MVLAKSQRTVLNAMKPKLLLGLALVLGGGTFEK